jgi:hypothetical protein
MVLLRGRQWDLVLDRNAVLLVRQVAVAVFVGHGPVLVPEVAAVLAMLRHNNNINNNTKSNWGSKTIARRLNRPRRTAGNE